MFPQSTSFKPAWWGTELPGARPRVGTYGRYSGGLPPLPFDLRGDFQWLLSQPIRRDHINLEKAAENKSALANLTARPHALRPPPEFLKFFSSPDLQRRIRSCTDCFLDLSPAYIQCPNDNGFLLRFLADSQGCLFWYLYQLPDIADHCILASANFFGTKDEDWEPQPPELDEIVFAEESFERFLCRFWLENEIWYCEYEKRPLPPEGRSYLEYFGRKK